MTLTPQQVREKQFNTVKMRTGYDMDEVDSFHDDDEAGRDARDNAKELLWRHVPLMKVRYPKDCTVETEEGDLRPPEDPAELNADQVEQMIADARLL